MAPSYDTVGYFAREAELFRKIGHILLEEEPVYTDIERLILAEDFFLHEEADATEALRRALDRIAPELPKPERLSIAGEEIADWRNAFRLIQGFEIQSTLLPFIRSHKDTVDLGPGIKERFDMAAAITVAEAEAAQAQRAKIAERLAVLAAPGTLIVLPTTPTLPPERGIPDGASFDEFRSRTLGFTCLAGHGGLPQMSIPGAEAAGCPIGLSFIGWQGGDEALLDLAVRLEPVLRNAA
jgi:amidase